MAVYWQVRHEMHMAIDRVFREADIVIAFPQQDLHIRTIDQAMLKDQQDAGPFPPPKAGPEEA